MFDNLQDKMDRVFKTLRGEASLNEWHIDNALKEIRVALLEADVNFKVVREFTNRVREKAVGQDVLTAFSPAQQVTKIVRDELQTLLGENEVGLALVGSPAVVMMVGLQGSGKTTTSGKLALHLKNRGRRPLLVPCDVYRPAAIEQLRVVANNVKVPFFEIADNRDPIKIANDAIRDAKTLLYDTVILDTAGRLHVDEELMQELTTIKNDVRPSEILFVADAMTGQDAVKSAKEFDDRLGVTGIVLTKLDGDARGGAALSIKSVVNRPIKFGGVGEKYADLDVFYPDRMAQRILGMGDVLSLIEKVETEVDKKEAARLSDKAAKDKFTLEDLRSQLQQVKKMGPLSSLVSMLPGAGKISEDDIDEKAVVRMQAILDSMTKKEREFPQIINGHRKKRIAKGSGTSVQEINRLLKQYLQMKKMMKTFSKGFGARKFGKMMKGLPPELLQYGGDEVAVKKRAPLRRPLLRRKVHVHDPDPLRVAVAPLEVLEQRPDEVAADVDARRHRARQRREVLAQVVDAERILDQVADRRRRVVERRAVFGDVERHRAVAVAEPQQQTRQRGRVHLPIRLRVNRLRLAHERGALDPLLRIVRRHAALVIVDADEVDRRGDDVEVSLGEPRPCVAEKIGHLLRIAAAEERIEILAVHVRVRAARRGEVLLAL